MDDTSLKNATWRTYTVADGLPSAVCEHVAEDQHGNLWIATAEDGACRFDGNEFVSFSRADGLCGDQVFAILPDSRGRIWFGTIDGGLCFYDGETFHQPPGFADIIWTFLYEDSRGRTWWAGPNCVGYCEGDALCDLSARYEDQLGKQFSGKWGIAEDEEGQIWLGAGLNGLVCYDGSAFHYGLKVEGLSFECVCKDAARQLWTAGTGGDTCKQTVELLGGTIDAQSQMGKGTTFILKIGDYSAP